MKKTIRTMITTAILTLAFSVTSLAGEYSDRWETQANGDWKYKLDAGGYATTAWVQDEVDHNWYLLGDNGIMRSGIFKSYDRYYLLSEVHDGHFGHLVKNGEVYKGITIQADTSADYEGALSAQTINALKAIGYNFDTVLDVSGTSHVSAGKITHEATKTTQTQDDSGLSAFEKALQGQYVSDGSGSDISHLVDEGGGTSGDEGMPVWNSETNRS